VERLRLSARGYHRVLRVARTLADLEGAAIVARRHVAEALSYRRMTVAPTARHEAAGSRFRSAIE
jgi:magnesium chelatase family protein